MTVTFWGIAENTNTPRMDRTTIWVKEFSVQDTQLGVYDVLNKGNMLWVPNVPNINTPHGSQRFWNQHSEA